MLDSEGTSYKAYFQDNVSNPFGTDATSRSDIRGPCITYGGPTPPPTTRMRLPSTLVVTPSIRTHIKTFNIAGRDSANIGAGVLPMSFAPAGGYTPRARERIVKDHSQAFNYINMMGTSGQHIPAQDSSRLTASRGYVPHQYTDAEPSWKDTKLSYTCSSARRTPW